METLHTLLLSFLLALLSGLPQRGQAASCGPTGIWLQVLGSGGPEIDDLRASSSYLVWMDGHARVLIDTGGGSAYNFERSTADFGDIRAILFTHFHVDHSADLSVYIKASYFTGRDTDLPIYGPNGNRLMPDTGAFVRALFDGRTGAFKYLGDFLTGGDGDSYRIVPHVLDTNRHVEQPGYQDERLRTTAVAVHHGPIPALAWKLVFGDKRLVFSGDMSNRYDTLARLAKDADVLVAHNAIPEGMGGVARALHMPPSVIGAIAARARVKKLVLSHRMRRTLGKEAETSRYIRKHYLGPLFFADDMDCIGL
ncbi:MAG TPA: MBL fold metallo-hydrolase [Gammaproteobacteria bacterium]|nr:MBL fold metallo-hydrolase [Gammaproteobacteria bacterium]